MTHLPRLGLIVNPTAGRGETVNLRAARAAINALNPWEVHTGPGGLGATALAGWGGRVRVHPSDEAPGRAATQRLAGELLAQAVDAVAVVGGDGTLADVALVCADQPGSAPLLGIGVGSTNVGPLITCAAERASALDPERLTPVSQDGVLAYQNGERLGIGFNDAVVGFTVVGTLDGRARDVDAAEKMHGRNVPGRPRGAGTADTRVSRLGPQGPELVALGESVGTLIVGFAERRFIGKAVAGAVCLAAYAGLPAGCLVCDRPLVQVEVGAEDLLGWPPVNTRFVGLGEGMRVLVEGVADGAALCADGNPLAILSGRDRVEFEVRRAAVSVLRFEGE